MTPRWTVYCGAPWPRPCPACGRILIGVCCARFAAVRSRLDGYRRILLSGYGADVGSHVCDGHAWAWPGVGRDSSDDRCATRLDRGRAFCKACKPNSVIGCGLGTAIMVKLHATTLVNLPAIALFASVRSRTVSNTVSMGIDPGRSQRYCAVPEPKLSDWSASRARDGGV